jgi:hypothetical protein
MRRYFKFLNVQGAMLTLSNRNFKHSKPSELVSLVAHFGALGAQSIIYKLYWRGGLRWRSDPARVFDALAHGRPPASDRTCATR